jgi:hypothetical protein
MTSTTRQALGMAAIAALALAGSLAPTFGLLLESRVNEFVPYTRIG